MFSITFFLSTNLPPVVLLYKGEESLNKALDNLETVNQMVLAGGTPLSRSVDDDFGQTLVLNASILGMLVQDMKAAQQADIERGVHQAVTQAMATDRAKTNPVLMQHMRNAQGPAVMTPFPANGRGF